MTAQIPEGFQDLLQDGTRAYAYLATTMADGSPQVTPVWFDPKDGLVRVNTTQGNTKWRNVVPFAGYERAGDAPKSASPAKESKGDAYEEDDDESGLPF